MTATNEVTGWVVVGCYEDGDRLVSEVMGAGFETREEATKAMAWMKRNASDVRFEVMSAVYAAEWVG